LLRQDVWRHSLKWRLVYPVSVASEKRLWLPGRAFVCLWLSSLIANLALAVAMLAETWYVVDTLGAKARLGLVMLATALPRVGLMLVGGVVADRLKRTRIMMASLMARALLALLLGGLFYGGRPGLATLTAFAFLYGALDAFFWPARDAVLPSVVEPDRLASANSVMLTTNQLGLVLGPVLGAVLLATMPLGQLFVMLGLVLALSALSIAFVNEPDVERSAHTTRMLAELREGVAYALKNPVLRSMMLIYALANIVFLGPNMLGVPLLASGQLAAGARGLSLLESSLAAGMVGCGLLLSVFPPQRRRLLVIAIVIAVEGLLSVALAHSTTLHVAMLIQFLIGAAIIANNVPMMAVLQHYTDREHLARVMSLNTAASLGLAPLSFAVVTALLSLQVPITWIMTSFGLGLTILMVTLALTLPTVRSAS
jgi:MFS transporter, DHA3 family, macrolide efflux protein